jgi:hypothetical protein
MMLKSDMKREDEKLKSWQDDSNIVMYGNRPLIPLDVLRCLVDEVAARGDVRTLLRLSSTCRYLKKAAELHARRWLKERFYMRRPRRGVSWTAAMLKLTYRFCCVCKAFSWKWHAKQSRFACDGRRHNSSLALLVGDNAAEQTKLAQLQGEQSWFLPAIRKSLYKDVSCWSQFDGTRVSDVVLVLPDDRQIDKRTLDRLKTLHWLALDRMACFRCPTVWTRVWVKVDDVSKAKTLLAKVEIPCFLETRHGRQGLYTVIFNAVGHRCTG